jgi:hypothetical protein
MVSERERLSFLIKLTCIRHHLLFLPTAKITPGSRYGRKCKNIHESRPLPPGNNHATSKGRPKKNYPIKKFNKINLQEIYFTTEMLPGDNRFPEKRCRFTTQKNRHQFARGSQALLSHITLK